MDTEQTAALTAKTRRLIGELTALLEELVDAAGATPAEPVRTVAPTLLTVEEAGEALRLSRTAVHGLIRTGELGSVLIGSRRRIPVAAVDEYTARLMAGVA